MGSFRRFAAIMVVAASQAFAQSPSGPTFEVVSIRPSANADFGSMRQRPDGGFVMANGSIRSLIQTAYPTSSPTGIVGLPSWAESERYDVTATATLSAPPTPDERREMMRAMLVDRFGLRAHYESREEPAFALVLARGDGRLGPEMKPAETDCEAQAAADRARAEAARVAGVPPTPPTFTPPAPGAPPLPCSLRMMGEVMEGDLTLEMLARMLRPSAGRHIVDQTGLTGYYHVVLKYDRLAGIRGPATAAGEPGDAVSIFTALPEQLGLKLEPTRATLEVLVVDSIERPSAN